MQHRFALPHVWSQQHLQVVMRPSAAHAGPHAKVTCSHATRHGKEHRTATSTNLSSYVERTGTALLAYR